MKRNQQQQRRRRRRRERERHYLEFRRCEPRPSARRRRFRPRSCIRHRHGCSNLEKPQ